MWGTFVFLTCLLPTNPDEKASTGSRAEAAEEHDVSADVNARRVIQPACPQSETITGQRA